MSREVYLQTLCRINEGGQGLNHVWGHVLGLFNKLCPDSKKLHEEFEHLKCLQEEVFSDHGFHPDSCIFLLASAQKVCDFFPHILYLKARINFHIRWPYACSECLVRRQITMTCKARGGTATLARGGAYHDLLLVPYKLDSAHAELALRLAARAGNVSSKYRGFSGADTEDMGKHVYHLVLLNR